VPSGYCSITIPADIVITFTGALFEVEIVTFTIDGSFIIVSGGVDITFAFSINIIIGFTGTFQTNTAFIYLRFDSIFTFLQGSTFIGRNTFVYAYTSQPAEANRGESFEFGSSLSGPFTLGILVEGIMQNYDSVMCIVRRSGSFTDDETWLGGIAPSVGFCDSVEGCGLYISEGFVLNTLSLNGVLTVRFTIIIIATGGTFQLGTPGNELGFQFLFTFVFEIFGSFEYTATSSLGISIAFGSSFNCYVGSIFISSIQISLIVFNPLTGAISGAGIALTPGLGGPFYVLVSESGETQISTDRKYTLDAFLSWTLTAPSHRAIHGRTPYHRGIRNDWITCLVSCTYHVPRADYHRQINNDYNNCHRTCTHHVTRADYQYQVTNNFKNHLHNCTYDITHAGYHFRIGNDCDKCPANHYGRIRRLRRICRCHHRGFQ
jgi:hypothetical protein